MTRETILKAAFCIFILAIVIYSNSLGGQFVYDDGYFIVKNIHIRDLGNIPYFFTNASSVAFAELSQDVYRPLTAVSYALDYHLWKLDTFGYHLANVLVHSLNAVLVFALLMLIAGNILIAVIAALIFAVHPIQTEVVAWISGRSSVLFLFFYLLSLITYVLALTKERSRYLVLSLACYAVALFSKEMAVSLPLVIVAYDIHFRDKEGVGRRLARYAPYVLLTVFFIAVRFLVLNRVSQCEWWGGTPYRTFLTMMPVIIAYGKLLIFPVTLCAFYVTPIRTTIMDAGVLSSIALLIMLLAATPFIFRRSRRASFFLWWFFITLLPVSNIVPLRALIAERFLYLPSIGFAALVAIFLVVVAKKYRVAAVVIAAGLILAYGARTMVRNEDWKDPISITSALLKVDPKNPWGLTSLGVAYSTEGRYEEAIVPLTRAIAMSDVYFAPKNVLGFCYVQLGRYQEAIAVLSDAVALKPNNIEALNSLGVAYANLGMYKEAIAQFEKTVLVDDAYVEGYINLGTAYDQTGQSDRAIEEYKKVEAHTRSRQDIAISYIRIGDVYIKLRQQEKANEYYERAIGLCGSGMDELKKIATDRRDARWDVK